jgi:chromosome segregation ATPase
MSTRDRFKRSLFGYRRREVDKAIADRDAASEAAEGKLAGAERRVEERDAELEARRGELESRAQKVRELDQVAARLAERVVERERELRGLRSELERARAESDQGGRALVELRDDLAAVRRQARGQATRIRLRALREAAELSERMRELGGSPGGVSQRLTEAVQEAIERVGVEGEEQGEEADVASHAVDNGYAERQPSELFEGLVEVEVGPLSDFSQLLGFEDAAGGIGAMSEISVRRFTQGRATLAMRLRQPVELLRELEERAPFEFEVRDVRSDRVVLDVAGE